MSVFLSLFSEVAITYESKPILTVLLSCFFVFFLTKSVVMAQPLGSLDKYVALHCKGRRKGQLNP